MIDDVISSINLPPYLRPVCLNAARMLGKQYGEQLLVRALFDVFSVFPDEVFRQLFEGQQEVWDHRTKATVLLAENLMQRHMPEKLLRSIEIGGVLTACL